MYMNMIYHNLKVALRNSLKYKVQTMSSILSLAIGMVTLDVYKRQPLGAETAASGPCYVLTWHGIR